MVGLSFEGLVNIVNPTGGAASPVPFPFRTSTCIGPPPFAMWHSRAPFGTNHDNIHGDDPDVGGVSDDMSEMDVDTTIRLNRI